MLDSKVEAGVPKELAQMQSRKLEIQPVRSKRDLSVFIKLPFRLYANEPNWVPPLLFERKQFLNRSRNPFFKHARAEYFIAWRNGRPVGRITAQVDDNFQQFHDNHWGHFGFFECEDDQEVATALIDTARNWLVENGCDHMMGPCDFTTNDELGILIDGPNEPPPILMPWTLPYYPKLIEGAGLTKAMDVLLWELAVAHRDRVNPIIWRLADRVESKHGITVRQMRRKDFEAEVGRFINVYNAAWERNWGFVPLTEDEVRHYAKELKPILDENFAFVAEKDGEPVGAALTLPDFNQVLIHLNGHLLPFGWLKALYYKRKINRIRVFALGVKSEYRYTGLGAKLYERHWDSCARRGMVGGEMGWVLENNRDMNKGMEEMGGRISRRYRLYEAEL